MRSNKKYLGFYAFVLCFLALDQLSKYFFVYIGDISISSWFNFTLSFNTGSAFGLPIPVFVSGIMGLIVACFCLFLPRLNLAKFVFFSRYLTIIFALFTAGVLGNTIDRLVGGSVIDFIHFSFWPIFNLADSYLVVAIIGYFSYEFYFKYKLTNNNNG